MVKTIRNPANEELARLEALAKIDVIGDMPDPTPKGNEGQAFRQEAGAGAGYINPTGTDDPTSTWSNDANIIDDDTGTYATYFNDYTNAWSNFIYVTHAGVRASRVRFYARNSTLGIGGRKVDIDVYKDGSWVNVAELTDYAEEAWVEVVFGEGNITQARIRFYNSHTTSIYHYLYEVEIYQVATSGGDLFVVSDDASDFLATVTQAAKDRTITLAKSSTEYSKGTIGAGAVVTQDLDLDDVKEIALTVKINYNASATDGVRVWILTSDDATFDTFAALDDPYNIIDADSYFDPGFKADEWHMKTVNLKVVSRYVRIAVENFDASNQVDSCTLYLHEVK